MSFLQTNQQGGAQQGGLFGSSNPSGTGSVFGAGATQNPTPGGGLFAANNANNSGSTGSVFGGGNNPVPSSGSGLFGGGGTTGSNLFGRGTTPSNNTPGAGGGSLFGGLNTNSNNSDAAAPKPNTFGGGGGLLGLTQSTTPSSGGLFGGSGSTTSGGGLFGGQKPAEQSTTPKPPGQNLFGSGLSSTSSTIGTGPASSGLFGSTTPKVADNSSTTPSNFSGGLFGSTAPKPAENAPASTLGTGTLSGALFGATTPKPTENATGSAPSSGTNTFGGGLFGKKPDVPTTTATPATTLPFSLGGSNQTSGSTPAPPGGLFGNPGAKDAKQDQAQASSLFGPPKDTAPAGTSAVSSFNLFGGSKTSTDKKDTPTAPSTTVTFPKEADKLKTTLGATSPPISAPPPSMLRGKTIEEIVNKWSSDLDVQVREFNKFATEVAVWDRALIENGNSLAALCNEMFIAEREQNEIDQSLEHIEQQQRDLLATLEAYEKTTEETLGGQGSSLRSLDTGPADTERDNNYMLASDLHSHLDDLSGSLTQLIDTVNGLSLSSASQQDASSGGDDPVNQIAQILSSHLESLQWVDDSVRELESKVSDVEKRVREAGVNVNGGGMGNSTSHGRSRSFGLSR